MINKNITVIGSSPDMWQALRTKLSETGYVVSFHDFGEAKELLKKSLPDLIVIDLIFPFQKTAEVLREIGAAPAVRKPVVFGLSELKALKDNFKEILSLNLIYPFKKLFPKPLRVMDMADEIHWEFFPNTKSLKLVLVIDDSPTQLGITIKNLSSSYNIITASNGREGLRLAMSEEPDLILLDLNMPDINGLKVCADLKSFHPTDKTPIVVYSGTMDQHQIHKAFLVGATDYITKESSEEELIKKIDKFLKSNYILPEIQN